MKEVSAQLMSLEAILSDAAVEGPLGFNCTDSIVCPALCSCVRRLLSRTWHFNLVGFLNRALILVQVHRRLPAVIR